MLDRVTIGVSDLPRARDFYDCALAPLGIVRLFDGAPGFAGYGEGAKPYFWIGARAGAALSAQTGAHVAFSAADRATVDAFHAAALAAGGRDNGAPGLRPHYHASYYGAFVLDPDGHNIEAVCHRSEP